MRILTLHHTDILEMCAPPTDQDGVLCSSMIIRLCTNWSIKKWFTECGLEKLNWPVHTVAQNWNPLNTYRINLKAINKNINFKHTIQKLSFLYRQVLVWMILKKNISRSSGLLRDWQEKSVFWEMVIISFCYSIRRHMSFESWEVRQTERLFLYAKCRTTASSLREKL